MMPGMDEPWEVESDGGSWSIISDSGYNIAWEIPSGAFADHIVELHNNSLE